MKLIGARGALAGLLIALLAFTGVAMAGGLVPNPANNKRILNKPIERFRYDHARKCLAHPQRGTLALQKWLGNHVRGTSWGIMRCERLGGGNYSLHSEGRAIDWHLDARRAREKRAATRLIRTFLARDRNGEYGALARRMGIQGLIFNCQSWWAGQQGLGKYSYCYGKNGKRKSGLNPTQAHMDHVHIELNWPGARKRTSFWE